jgi:NAD(P)-dependent dehydrogenase (short-subunit alcohol dehydrogenase family)
MKKCAVITGATGGVGKEVARVLAESGVGLVLVGRSIDRMESISRSFRCQRDCEVQFLEANLESQADIVRAAEQVRSESRIDYLIHCAAHYSYDEIRTAPVSELDRAYSINVRAPYLITQSLLPNLIAAHGTVVFVNSSIINSGGRNGLSHYGMTKAALKMMADCLRQEVSGRGVRVVTIVPGKIATPMQEKACRLSGLPYSPEKMLQPAELAQIVCDVATLPSSVEMTDIHVRPSVPYDV